jgi:hypothetical protein
MRDKLMQERTFLVAVMWFFSAIVLGALFISAAAQGELTTGHISLAILILCAVFIATPLLARWKDGTVAFEKSKRERIDTMLRDMSDEDLLELKTRLSAGTMSEENIIDYLESDGELASRR